MELHWENEMKWKTQIGGQFLKPLKVLRLLTTNSTNSTNN